MKLERRTKRHPELRGFARIFKLPRTEVNLVGFQLYIKDNRTWYLLETLRGPRKLRKQYGNSDVDTALLSIQKYNLFYT